MIDDKIKKWVNDSVDQGYSLDKIKQNLSNFGYFREDIDELIKDIHPKNNFSPPLKESFSEKILDSVKEHYLFLIIPIFLIIVLIAVWFISLNLTSVDFCEPISITLERGCKLDEGILLEIKNLGISFSEFNYYVNDKFANKEKFIFEPGQISSFKIKSSLLESQAFKERFPEINFITISPVSNMQECFEKSIVIENPTESC